MTCEISSKVIMGLHPQLGLKIGNLSIDLLRKLGEYEFYLFKLFFLRKSGFVPVNVAARMAHNNAASFAHTDDECFLASLPLSRIRQRLQFFFGFLGCAL